MFVFKMQIANKQMFVLWYRLLDFIFNQVWIGPYWALGNKPLSKKVCLI